MSYKYKKRYKTEDKDCGYVIVLGEKISKVCLEVGVRFHGNSFLDFVKHEIKESKKIK